MASLLDTCTSCLINHPDHVVSSPGIGSQELLNMCHIHTNSTRITAVKPVFRVRIQLNLDPSYYK